MFGSFTYLLWLLLFIFLPLFALGVWQRRIWRQWRAAGRRPRLFIENAGWRHDP